MRKTVPVRVSANLHSEIARIATAAGVPITTVFDVACIHFIKSGADVAKLIGAAESAYDAALTQAIVPTSSPQPAKKSPPPAVTDEEIDVDELIDTTDLNEIL